MLVFAYDGSLNGDWVAHYAVRFAANTSARTLRLVHVHEASVETHVRERVAQSRSHLAAGASEHGDAE